MAVATFTMEDVVNGVLNQMRFAPGRDVQIHLQSSIIQDASMMYRAMMKRYIWRDFYKIFETPISATTGLPTTDVSMNVDRYSNLLAVYKDNESEPLPFAPALINPKRYNRPCVSQANPPSIFQVWPHQAITCLVYSRIFQDADFELDDVVPFYKDILVLGTAVALATKSGINMELIGLLKEQLNETIDMYRMDEIKPQYQVNQPQGAVPMEWYSYDN